MREPLIISVIFASTAIAVGVSQYSFGLFIVPIEETYGWSRTQISASLSFAAVGALAAPFLGRAMDRYGVRPILVVSLAVFGLSFCLRPLMTELWHWYVVSFLQFAPTFGMTVLPTGRLVAAWYPHMRGRMTGVAATGNNVGGLVMPFLVAALLAAMTWSDASVVIGVASFGVAGAAALAIREAPPVAEARTRRGDTRDGHAAMSPPALPDLDVRASIRTPMFYAVLVTITLGAFTYSTILPHALAHLVNKGMANASALAALGTIAVGGIFGKLFFGWMADRFSARRMTMANLAGQAVFTALLAGADHAAVLVVAAPLYGFFLGGFGTLYILMVQESFGLRHYGSIMGLMNLGAVVPLGLGPIIAGASYDIWGSYDAAFFITCGLFVAAAVTLVFARPRTPDTPSASERRL